MGRSRPRDQQIARLHGRRLGVIASTAELGGREGVVLGLVAGFEWLIIGASHEPVGVPEQV
ncbi:hypothetical protein [Paenarthrobacter sp. 2TAF44]|uniref:hypothetical protein n=1 Tax=Paenarthrobacter sp. 2TAF44 TaxID=3233018 RepID=UPI003F96B4D1